MARQAFNLRSSSISNLGVNGSTLTQSGAFSLNLTTTAATTATFPSGTITLADLGSTQTFSGAKTFSAALTVSNTASITSNSTTSTLTLSQNGTGRALVTNGDIVFANGTSAQYTASSGVIPKVQIVGTDTSSSAFGLYRFSTNTLSNGIYFGKSKTATIGGFTAVTAGDGLGAFLFEGANNSAFVRAASISVEAEATFSTTSAPGRINFNVTPTGAVATELAMSIRQNKLVELAGGLSVAGGITANTTTNNQSYTTTGTGTITITSGTAGNIDNMNIGATTAGTGSFTSLSASGNISLNNNTIQTNQTSVSLLNTIATTINAFGAATSISIGAATGTTTVNNNFAVTGNLTVNGTTTTVNSTTITVDDPIITLGGDVAPTTDDNKDRGVEFRWHNGTSAKVGFFGYDDSTGYLTFIPDATNTAEVFSGALGDIQAANFRGSLIGNASSASTVSSTVTGTNSATLVSGQMADNDLFRILVGGTASNAGFVEIATADDGTEPIHVRQYTGIFSTLVRTATLLDGTGNTSFPGALTIGTHTGNGSTLLATAGTVVSSASQQGGRVYESGHDFNSYPNLYSSIFINTGTATNIPSGAGGNSYRFIMGAGDTTSRGFDLLGTSQNHLFFRPRETGTWSRALSTSDTTTSVTFGELSVGTNAVTMTQLSTTNPASLFSGTAINTDNSTAANGTATHGTVVSFARKPIAATNTGVTYTNASTLYIDGTPTAGTNVSITNPYSLYVNSGLSFFNANVTVNGTLSATSKSFLIDHPLDPENKYLRYACLEGPENGVYVRGKLTGSNTITLPDHWVNLVDESTISVNITPIGKYQQLYVEDISNNTVIISNTALEPINCFYTVFAERKDIEKLKVEGDK